MPASPRTIAPLLRRMFICAALLAALLVGVGLFVFPAARTEWRGTLPGLAGVGIVLVGYALFGVWGTSRLERTDERLLPIAVSFGLIGAAIYAAEIILEYVFLPGDNTRYGYVEFGLVLLSYLATGYTVGLKTRRVRNGLMAAVGAALISTLVWYIVLLAITYVMKGTPRQAAVFRAEGNMDEFARSGSASFEAWLMQDFLGAGFYHLLLGILISAFLGSLGGGIGRMLARGPKRV